MKLNSCGKLKAVAADDNKMKRYLLCIFLITMPVFGDAGEERLSELDKEIIKFFREEEVGTGAIDYPDKATYHKKLDWYWDQGQKARPALMYLLTEVYEGDFSNMTRAMNALCAMDGDRSDVLAYVRERLPKINALLKTQGKFGHIQASLRVLGKFGTPEDMELIRSFLNHPDVVVRSTAMSQERNLQARIDAGEFNEPETRRKPGSNDREENHEESFANDPANRGKSEENKEIDSSPGWIFIVMTVLLVGALFLWRRGKNRQLPRDE